MIESCIERRRYYRGEGRGIRDGYGLIQMVKKVTLYTDHDDASNLARKYLIEHNVAFKEVDANKEGISILKRRLPFLEVRKSGGIGTVEGFGEFQYAQALDPTLSYNTFLKLKKAETSDEIKAGALHGTQKSL